MEKGLSSFTGHRTYCTLKPLFFLKISLLPLSLSREGGLTEKGEKLRSCIPRPLAWNACQQDVYYSSNIPGCICSWLAWPVRPRPCSGSSRFPGKKKGHDLSLVEKHFFFHGHIKWLHRRTEMNKGLSAWERHERERERECVSGLRRRRCDEAEKNSRPLLGCKHTLFCLHARYKQAGDERILWKIVLGHDMKTIFFSSLPLK